jgi:hypothetical protein
MSSPTFGDFPSFGSAPPAEAAAGRPAPQQEEPERVDVAEGAFSFPAWSSLAVNPDKAPVSPQKPQAATATSMPETRAPEAQELPQQQADSLAIERLEQEKGRAWAEAQDWAAKAERAAFELGKEKETTAFLRRQLEEREADLKAARLEALSYRQTMTDARDVVERRKLEGEVAKLRREAEEARKAPELRDQVKRLEGELRGLRKAQSDWDKEKGVLEKHSAAWLGRMDEAKRKEVVAREHVAPDVAELERVLKTEGTRQFLKLLYRRHPPMDGQKLGDLSNNGLNRTLKLALVAYHSDRQDVQLHGIVWQTLCTQVCALLNSARDDYK